MRHDTSSKVFDGIPIAALVPLMLMRECGQAQKANKTEPTLSVQACKAKDIYK